MTPDDGVFLLRQSFRDGLPAVKLSGQRDYKQREMSMSMMELWFHEGADLGELYSETAWFAGTVGIFAI